MFMSWVSVVGMPRNPDAWRTPPFIFHNPGNKQRTQVNDVLDIHRIFNGWSNHHFEWSLMLAHPLTFMDREIQKVLGRLDYCERFHVPPFPGDFTEHPAWWVKVVKLIDHSKADARRYLERKA